MTGLSIEEFISDTWQYTGSDAPFSEAELDRIVELRSDGLTPSEAAAIIDHERMVEEAFK
jgi:hypothetical protein